MDTCRVCQGLISTVDERCPNQCDAESVTKQSLLLLRRAVGIGVLFIATVGCVEVDIPPVAADPGCKDDWPSHKTVAAGYNGGNCYVCVDSGVIGARVPEAEIEGADGYCPGTSMPNTP